MKGHFDSTGYSNAISYQLFSLVPPGDKKDCQVGAGSQENGGAGGKRWKAGDWGCHGGPWSGGRTGGTWAEGNQQYLRDMMAC